MSTLQIIEVKGSQIQDWMSDIQHLRTKHYSSYPYLCDDPSQLCDRQLNTYTRSPNSIFFIIVSEGTLIGLSIGLPLSEELEDYRRPFIEAGLDPSEYFYCAETTISSVWDTKATRQQLLKHQETYARNIGAQFTVACDVQRDQSHPLKPSNHLSLASNLYASGYTTTPQLVSELAWRDQAASCLSHKAIQFFIKPLLDQPSKHLFNNQLTTITDTQGVMS